MAPRLERLERLENGGRFGRFGHKTGEAWPEALSKICSFCFDRCAESLAVPAWMEFKNRDVIAEQVTFFYALSNAHLHLREHQRWLILAGIKIWYYCSPGISASSSLGRVCLGGLGAVWVGAVWVGGTGKKMGRWGHFTAQHVGCCCPFYPDPNMSWYCSLVHCVGETFLKCAINFVSSFGTLYLDKSLLSLFLEKRPARVLIRDSMTYTQFVT